MSDPTVEQRDPAPSESQREPVRRARAARSRTPVLWLVVAAAIAGVFVVVFLAAALA